MDVLHTRVCRRCSRSLQRRQKRSKRQTSSDEDRQLHCTHKASIVVLLLDTIDATFFSLHAAAHSLRKSTFSLRTPIDNKHKTLLECASDDFFFEATKNAPGRQAGAFAFRFSSGQQGTCDNAKSTTQCLSVDLQNYDRRKKQRRHNIL